MQEIAVQPYHADSIYCSQESSVLHESDNGSGNHLKLNEYLYEYERAGVRGSDDWCVGRSAQ